MTTTDEHIEAPYPMNRATLGRFANLLAIDINCGPVHFDPLDSNIQIVVRIYGRQGLYDCQKFGRN